MGLTKFSPRRDRTYFEERKIQIEEFSHFTNWTGYGVTFSEKLNSYDDNLTTYASITRVGAGTGYLIIDFGKKINVSSLYWNLRTASAGIYTLEYSEDGINYFPLDSWGVATRDGNKINLIYQYLKISMSVGAGTYTIYVNELRTFGTENIYNNISYIY